VITIALGKYAKVRNLEDMLELREEQIQKRFNASIINVNVSRLVT
jgi:hypothetical protein